MHHQRRHLTAHCYWERRIRPRRLPIVSSADAAPPLVRPTVRRRAGEYLASTLPRRLRGRSKPVAAVFDRMVTPGGGSAPALLQHHLGASFPRSRILQPWPQAPRPQAAPLIQPPAPPAPTSHVWPPVTRRRPGPTARRVIPRAGLAWLTSAATPGAFPFVCARRRPAPCRTRRRPLPDRWAAFFPRPTLPTELLRRDKRRRPVAPRLERLRRGERLAAFRLCHDPAMSMARFRRQGYGAARIRLSIGDTEFGAAVFVRAGAAASTLYRSRC